MAADGGGTLFLLAHHDDEVFCAGHLRRALPAPGTSGLLWATAGGLAPARRRLAEGARVLRLLGLPADAATIFTCAISMPWSTST